MTNGQLEKTAGSGSQLGAKFEVMDRPVSKGRGQFDGDLRYWVSLAAKTVVVIALFIAGCWYLDLKVFRDANLADVNHLYQCRKAAVDMDIAPSLHNLFDSGDEELNQRWENEQIVNDKQAAAVNSECLRWARSGFGTLVK